VREGPAASWRPRLKVSEAAAKTTVPGRLQVRRYAGPDGFLADAIHDLDLGLPPSPVIVDPLDVTRRREVPAGAPGHDLLVPIFRGGRRIYQPPTLEASRALLQAELSGFHAGVKRFVHPHQYPVGLERSLSDLRVELTLAARRAPR